MDRKTRIGVIGCGNMGGALVTGWAANGHYELYGTNRTMARMEPLIPLGVTAMHSMNEMLSHVDYVVLGVKPNQIEAVVSELAEDLLQGKVLISLAAGVSLGKLKHAVNDACPVVRCMPNTPAMVGEGVFALCFGEGVEDEQQDEVKKMFSTLGVSLVLSEERFPAFSGLIGAGPAFVFELMEGMVMAGATMGFTHADSRAMVEALFKGCACMAQKNRGTHLIALRDSVCSPAGLTIAGVNRMCADGVSGKLAEAVLTAARRGREMED